MKKAKSKPITTTRIEQFTGYLPEHGAKEVVDLECKVIEEANANLTK